MKSKLLLILTSVLIHSTTLLSQSVWLENPAGITFSLGPHFINSIDLDHGDLDKDGHEDVVLVNVAKGEATVEIYRNSGASIFMLQESKVLVKSTATAVKLGDLDNDGDQDIVITNFKGHNNIYFNEGNMKFSTHHRHFGHTDGTIHAIQLADMDLDGDLDIVLAHHKLPNEIALNDGMGNFNQIVVFGDEWATSDQIAVGDINGDSYPDIVEVNSKGMPSYIYYSKGGNLNFTSKSFGSSKLDSKSVDLGDMNGDGRLDIVIGNRLGENEIYLIDENGKPGESIKFSTKDKQSLGIKVSDINNDSLSDILVANYKGENELFLNKGGMVFDHQFLSDKKFASTAIFSFDINGDGNKDVIETNFEHLNLYYITHLGSDRSADKTESND